MGPVRQSYWQCKEQRLYHSGFLLFKRQVERGLCVMVPFRTSERDKLKGAVNACTVF